MICIFDNGEEYSNHSMLFVDMGGAPEPWMEPFVLSEPILMGSWTLVARVTVIEWFGDGSGDQSKPVTMRKYIGRDERLLRAAGDRSVPEAFVWDVFEEQKRANASRSPVEHEHALQMILNAFANRER